MTTSTNKNLLAAGVLVCIAIAMVVFTVIALIEFFQANGDGRTHDMTFWGFILVFIGVGSGSSRSRS